MAIQTTSLEGTLQALEEKAEEYDTRTNTEQRVRQAEEDLQDLNRALGKLKTSVNEFERLTGVLSEVFEEPLPTQAMKARDKVRSVLDLSQEDVIEVIDDGTQSLSQHIESVRVADDTVREATQAVTNEVRDIQGNRLSEARTAENIQKIVGEDRVAMKTISQYKRFLNGILNPDDSVSMLKSQWQGLEKAFENLDTDWRGFQERHDLSNQTIEDLRELSEDGKVDLDELTTESITEMMEVSELRSTIKVSI